MVLLVYHLGISSQDFQLQNEFVFDIRDQHPDA
jgi:hypothetical protein